MFHKGPRFIPQKRNVFRVFKPAFTQAFTASEVPGPNTYNPQLSPQDAYKRGAFIEKTDRFSTQLSADPNMKPTTINPQAQNTTDRYAILQRKVADLERLHNNGKKAHQTEVDHLKAELARVQKSNTDLTDRSDKLRKDNKVLDLRVQDLKKAASSDQAEIKDLRVKLKMSEQEKTQLSNKQDEATDIKNSLQSLESRRREEVREKDRRIADLEKAVAGEKKKREIAETKYLELKSKYDQEFASSREAAQKSEALVNAAQAETLNAQRALSSLKAQSECNDRALLVHLEQYQLLLRQVAEEYGCLVSRTVPISDHTQLKLEYTTLLAHTDRLESRLSRSQILVVELTSMIRDAKEQIEFLTTQLHEADLDMSSCFSALVDVSSTPPLWSSSFDSVYYTLHDEFAEWRSAIQTVDARSSELASDFYRMACEALLLAHSVIDKELQGEQLASRQHAADLSSALASHEAIAACLETTQREQHAAEARLKTATDLTEKLKLSSDSMARQLSETEEKMRLAAAASNVALQKEKDTVQKLTSIVQKCRMAEDALRSEIELLTTELTNAEKYQEAYYSLSGEVGSLVVCNQLAEEEAQRLSKFNAEILSHNNPAQRIMYVDRIRRELAETKHKLAMLTREQESVVTENENLQHELNMYKSVVVPVEHRPRTNITRVARAPFVDLTQSLNTGNLYTSEASAPKANVNATKADKQVLETVPGDMTLEEIM